MGEQKVQDTGMEGDERRAFMQSLLDDLQALELLIENGRIESGVRRVGAEQELFVVDESWRPAPRALDLLERLDDERYTTELARFNLELNLDPQVFVGDVLSKMENQLDEMLDRVQVEAERLGVHCALIGILPTLRHSDLGLENMTPRPRYRALDRAIQTMRGGTPFEFRIKGLDELILKHDSVMVEACNCSFQVHFQVGADEFAHLYNVAQAVAGPVLAVATNSPLLFGRRLWRETRVATFQQSLDTRSTTMHMRELSPRVSFGRRFVDDSVLELFKEDVARFRVLLGGEVDECSLRTAREGGVPSLRALRMHNGTIYRWNRACYGITDGVPHLRIENRLFPSGPTVVDEIANAAFWFGLIGALSDHYDDVRRVMDFDDAAANFQAAARLGLNAQFEWLEGRTYPAQDLLRQELLPLAREGLVSRDIDASDADRFLGVVEERIESRQTGSQWMLSSLARMREGGTEGERLNALTAAALQHQRSGLPVARWPLARLEDAGGWEHNFLRVEQYMTTDMFTVHEEEPIDLVANLMDWERIRHVPVEDEEHRLVGLVSYRSLLRYLARARTQGDGRRVSVRDIMTKNPVTVGPDTRTLEAIAIMRERRLGCLPVIKDGRLVGVIVERDFMGIASELLSEKLGERE